ncbi:hypothetical protein FGB62_19g283 [Gracilaria domingensis]|nr:hypothetical protein FGB62_19g283 [Gracilaria domingensis]
MVVLRPPVPSKAPVSARNVASPPPVAAPAPAAATSPAANAASSSSIASSTPQATAANHNIVAKAAVSPPSIASRLASLQKLSSSTMPPSTSQLRSAADDEQTPPSPSFHPLHKRHSHGSHSAVSSSLAKMEKLAADVDEASSKPQPSSSAQKRPLPNPQHGADPGAGENFWQWFQDTKDSEGSTNVTCPPEAERVCLMFYKFLKKYKIRSVYDISCANNLEWMPPIVKKAGNELWGFKYYCNTNADELPLAKEKLAGLSYVEFAPDQWWRTGFAEDTQLLFAWDVLPHIAYGRIWNFFVKSKAQNIKYLLFDNYPGIMNDPVR